MLAPVCLALAFAFVAPPLDADELLLTEAGLATDGPGLVAFLKTLSPSDKERQRLTKLVGQLGDDSFEVREKASASLTAAGPAALPPLRTGLVNADLEVVRRAQRCIEQIEGTPHAARLSAALRLIAQRKPAGATEALLDHIDWRDKEAQRVGALHRRAERDDREDASEEVLQTLAAVGVKGKSPTALIRKTLADRSGARRAAAAWVVGRAAVEHRKGLVALLRDPSALVRFNASWGLLTAREKRSLPVLIALLGHASVDLGGRAEGLLLLVAGDSAPAVGWTHDAQGRKAAVKAWQKWWDERGGKLDLAKVRFDEAPLGWTVICEFELAGPGAGHVRALGPDGKERWHVSGIASPTDVRLLPNGRLLIAEHHTKRIIECDRTGKVIQEMKLSAMPVACQRLPNGNTFIATYSSLLELTPDGKQVYSIAPAGGFIYDAKKLRDGRIVSIDMSGTVREYDKNRKEICNFRPAKHAGGAAYWAGVERLPGDRYLLSLAGSGKVIETDQKGKILWEATVQCAGGAIRLRNGRTLVVSSDGKFVVELDAAGKQVWKATTKFRPFRARRY